MPRRLDPEKGLPGLFQSSRPAGGDMGFLVREGGEPSRKPRARAASPAPAQPAPPPPAPEPRRARSKKRASPPPLAGPASTISQISGKHARPKPPEAAPAPSAPEAATASSDAAPPATSTSSGSFERPVVVTLAPIAREPAPFALVPAPPTALVLVAPAPLALVSAPVVPAIRVSLEEAGPVCRVPEARPEPERLALGDAVGFVRCAVAWAGFAVKGFLRARG